MLKPYQYCMVALLCSGASFIQAAENEDGFKPGLTGFDLKFINDSNPAKAEFERDIEETNSFSGRVTANLYSKELYRLSNLASGISLNGSASYEINSDIEELGEARYRVSVDWFREDNSREIAPFYRASLGLGFIDSETQIRDSTFVDATISGNIQPTDFFDSTLGLSVQVRDADTAVFDTTKGILFLTGNFSPVKQFVLRAGFRYVFGNEVSTATPTLDIVNTAEAIEPDEAFGGRAANRFAYLLDANSAIFEVGLGFRLSDAIETNLLYRVVSTSADNDIGYDRNMLELTLSYSL